ncbi:MAG: hypothetical protein ACI4HI_18775 [Lachnospiraceae bacterium]
MIYLYTEDSKSGYAFWKFICDTLFQDTIEVRNLGEHSNSTKLLEFVYNITDRENTYLISYDLSFDNKSVMESYVEVQEYLEENQWNNIIFLDFISFEYILLTFNKLIEWCFSENDFLKEKRSNLLKCREDLINLKSEISDYKGFDCLRNFICEHNISNIEQCCSKLLYAILRNTGFEIRKGSFGECWYVDCCEYSKKEDDDECGLSELLPTAGYKALEIYRGSCIKQRFDELGLI